jgi:cytochrome P450
VTTGALELPFLDVADPAFSVRSEAVASARARGPYARTPFGLAVLRHEEITALIRDRRLIQGSAAWPDHVGLAGPWADWWRRIVLNREGDDHARLRRLTNPAFASGLVEAMLPQFSAIAEELIDGFAADGRCEFMRDFAEPYATRVVARLLGIPESEWRTLAGWSEGVGLGLAVTASRHRAVIEAALDGLFGYADRLIEDRKRAPRDDFPTRLVRASVDRDSLTDEELRDTIVLLIFGGIDTTRNQLGLGLDLFARHPRQWALLRDRPELAPAAVEEIMRLRPTTTWVTREAIEDFELDGIAVPRGTTLHLLAESGGTDPLAVRGDAGFDLTATDRPRHFGFGGGRHHCLGRAIARSDLAVALERLSARFETVAHDGPPSFLPDSGNTGPIELPLRFG